MTYNSQIYRLGYPVIDMHTHLRNDMEYHTKILKSNGLDVVVCMANTNPVLDRVEIIEEYMKQHANCQVIPVSAMTINQEGKKPVDIEKNRRYVVGFSDDGKYMGDMGLFREMLGMNILIMPHLCPPYEIAVENPKLQIRYLENYLDFYVKTKTKLAKLHIQHLSRKPEVDMIRNVKKSGIYLTCETCHHYYKWSREDIWHKVNPPLGTKEDVLAIQEGLADGTIDVIVSDYAPHPRVTGFAIPDLYIDLSLELVSKGILTEEQLKEKLFTNPKRIIESAGYKLDL